MLFSKTPQIRDKVSNEHTCKITLVIILLEIEEIYMIRFCRLTEHEAIAIGKFLSNGVFSIELPSVEHAIGIGYAIRM